MWSFSLFLSLFLPHIGYYKSEGTRRCGLWSKATHYSLVILCHGDLMLSVDNSCACTVALKEMAKSNHRPPYSLYQTHQSFIIYELC